MNLNNYWLYLEPFTFCFIKNNIVLIYNSLSGENFTCHVDEKIRSVINELLLPSNMYSILLPAYMINDQSVSGFIKNIQQIMAGDIVPVTQETEKPIIIFPKLNIHNDVKRFDSLTRHNILENLRQITICLDYSSKPVHGKETNNVQANMEIIKKVLDKITNFKWIEIGIDTGKSIKQNLDIFNYLVDIFLDLNFKVTIKIDAENFKIINIPDLEKCLVNIIVHPDFNESTLEETVIQSQNIADCFFVFHIANEDDYDRAESFCNKVKNNSRYFLLYDGSNFSFFDKYLYLEVEDILSERISRKDIFRNQSLNTNDFGKFTIMPNGKVYANPLHKPLGTIDDDIRTLVYKEMTEGQSWLRIRGMAPCNDCVYQWLCPSPSDYEIAIGRPNLCKVKQQ